MKDRRKILEENMTEVKDSIMFSEIKSIKVVVSVVSWQFSLMNLFCSLAVLDPRVGHTMDVLSLFITVLCHSD